MRVWIIQLQEGKVTTKEELLAIEAEYETAECALREVSARRNAARQDVAQQVAGVKTGDRVLHKDAYYVVSHFDVRFTLGKPWLYGFKVLKSGVVSTNKTCLYDYWKKS